MNTENIVLIILGLAAVLSVALGFIAALRAGHGAEKATETIKEEFRADRGESLRAARELREEIATNWRSTGEAMGVTLDRTAKVQSSSLESMSKRIDGLSEANQASLERVRLALGDGLAEVRKGNDEHLAEIRTTLDRRVNELQESNEKKLDEMRRTVDEKLHDTLERRLGESFKFVSERLEAVHKGLGEMQTLATGVGDLKRVLTNVKVRGSWAELQLGALLEQILTPDQYDKNISVKSGSLERVEFAIRLPGPKGDPDGHCWIPIDSKFPQEDYVRLQEAAERADPDAVQLAVDGLGRAVKACAKSIHDKYVNPPETTDFAVMYLATEGLFAEVLRQQGLAEELLNKYRVVVTGPSTLAAFLSSLRMGFQTLVIEKRASEVWRVLAAVKTEFGKFGDVLDKVQKQLGTASRTIEETGRRSRAIERQLRGVDQLPETDAATVLGLPRSLDALTSEAEDAEVLTDAPSQAPSGAA